MKNVIDRHIIPKAQWLSVLDRMREVVPEAFLDTDRVLNLIGGQWGQPGTARDFFSPCDGTLLCRYPMLNASDAHPSS